MKSVAGAALAAVLMAAGVLVGSPTVATAAQSASVDCYHSLWQDPQDAPELDVSAYGAFYDCSTATWTFPAVTRDTWPDSELDAYEIQINADANATSGCNGFEWMILGRYQSGQLQSTALHTPSCDPSTWTPGGSAGIDRPDQSTVRLTVTNAALGSPTDIRWRGFLKGVSESSGDSTPDSGFHEESGFAGSQCTAPLFGRRSVMVTDQPAAARRVTGGKDDGEGVVTFKGDPLRAEAALAGRGISARITTDHRLTEFGTPNDPDLSMQWGLAQVGAPAAWNITHGSANVIVADIDSGVDDSHADLAGKLVPGYDATTGSALAKGNSDQDGHGTATAGVIGAATDDGVDAASLGWNTSIMPIKVGDSNGIDVSNAVAGIRYAADHGAKVANMSWGSACPDPQLDDAISYAESKDVVLVASAGNDQQDGDYRNYPAADPGVLAVGATGADGKVTTYSNIDDYVSLVAPGGSSDGNPADDIVVLKPGGGTTTDAGTSFAAPMVSAAAALVRAVRPDLDAARVADLLTSTATTMGGGRNVQSGYGLVNPAAALTAAKSAPATKPLTRLSGPTRIDTAIAVSQAAFPTGGSATAAVLVTADTFADALAGTPLAVAKGGPLLLTAPDALDPHAAAELQRVVPAGRTVYLLGGGLALSDAVARSVASLGYTVVRYGGKNRFETATIVASEGLGNPSSIIEATGLDFADALAGGAAAAANHAAVLLTAGSSQAIETGAYISAHPGDTRFALGGAAAAADSSAHPLVGADRYATSALVAKAFFSGPAVVGVASGLAFPDALAGGAHIARRQGPMLLVPPGGPLPAAVTSYLQATKDSLTGGFVYGGTGAVGDDVEAEVQQAIS